MDNLDRLISVIIFADIVGYSSMMQKDEQKALAKLTHFEDVLKIQSEKYEGEIIKSYGDGSLMIFSSAVNAIKCAISIQKNLRTEPYVPLRIGIHIGEIVRKGHDIFGDGLNIASRIESMGVANSVLISSDIYFQVKNHPAIKTVKIGDFTFKNIERDITLYAISNDDLAIPQLADMKGKGKVSGSAPSLSNKKLKFLWIPVILFFVAGIIYWVNPQWLSELYNAQSPPKGLIFATKVEANGQAVDPSTTFSQNITDLYAVFASNMAPPGMKINVEDPQEGAYYAYLKVTDASTISKFGWRWYFNGEVVNEHEMELKPGNGVWLQRWDYSGDGVFSGDFGPGKYTIVILIDSNPAMSAELIIEPHSEDLNSEKTERVQIDDKL
ncbi:MAG: adenylate/guanylate cyclase domain-containing protein [Flavobacteriaceae bacterium]